MFFVVVVVVVFGGVGWLVFLTSLGIHVRKSNVISYISVCVPVLSVCLSVCTHLAFFFFIPRYM